jgi:hypothetical protein
LPLHPRNRKKNHFSIPKRTRKKKNHFSKPKRSRKNHFSIPKRMRKHHPFTSKEPAKPEERKKFIEKTNLPRTTREKGSVSNTLKRDFCLQFIWQDN